MRPHAATSAVHTGIGGAYKTLAYDANGNLDYVNSISESDYTFDAENRVKTRTYGAATTSYVYDGAGTMVKRTTAGAGAQSETTVYVGGLYEKNVTTGAVTKYYSALGRTIAMRKNGALSYLLADHLGGTTAVLDASGNVVSSRKYWPYGAERSMSGDQRATDMWYTGQHDEDYDGLGLYNYKARFYSTMLGRFVSADPLTSDGLNRYAYVRNNPLRWLDPTGLYGISFPIPEPVVARAATNPHGSVPDPATIPVPCYACEDLIALAGACAVNPSSWVCQGHTTAPATPTPTTTTGIPTPGPRPTAPVPSSQPGESESFCEAWRWLCEGADATVDFAGDVGEKAQGVATDPDCWGLGLDAVAFGADYAAGYTGKAALVSKHPAPALVTGGLILVGLQAHAAGLILDVATGDAVGVTTGLTATTLGPAQALPPPAQQVGLGADYAAVAYGAAACRW